MKIKKIEKKVALDVQAQKCGGDCVFYLPVFSFSKNGTKVSWKVVRNAITSKFW